ncbi:aldehyde dehydrogenase family protein [Paraburkholderia sp. 32]|uniref:aldehyde dehydrogenase family protein n=2 Tax=unclassified Paraburkholderia TaxID=2615204 RepID=UPI003D1C8241
MNASRWIAGEWTGTPTLDSIDPATGEAIDRFADGGADEADAAIAAARHVFDRTTWAQDARLRQDVLRGSAAALDTTNGKRWRRCSRARTRRLHRGRLQNTCQ